MKKIKNYFKPAISIVLLIVMVFCNCTFVAAQTEQDAILEWTNLDSICVKLKTQSHNTFTPEDFPEINCKRVVVYDKEITDDGYFYEAVLVVSYSSVDNYIDNQLSAILNNEYVVTATENTNRKQLLDIYIMGGGHYNELYIGQSTSSGISKDYLYENDNCFDGVIFTIDNNILPDDYIDEYSFRRFGITRFYPIENLNGNIRALKDHEGERSTIQTYCAIEFDQITEIEFANELVSSELVTRVSLLEAEKNYYGEDYSWQKDNNCIDILSQDKYRAEFKAIAPGTTTIDYMFRNPDGTAKNKITITVLNEYRKGDVNEDAAINSSDALSALQRSINKISLDEEADGRCDVDRNGEINSKDALFILKFSVTKESDGGCIERYVDKHKYSI